MEAQTKHLKSDVNTIEKESLTSKYESTTTAKLTPVSNNQTHTDGPKSTVETGDKWKIHVGWVDIDEYKTSDRST